MSDLVNAKWVGPSGLALTDGTELVPGETVVAISKGEAETSDNWQPVGGNVAKDSKKGDD